MKGRKYCPVGAPENFLCRSATDQKYFLKQAGCGRGGAGMLPTVVPYHPVAHHAVLHVHLVAVVVQITRGRIVVKAQLRDHPVRINMDLENRRKKLNCGCKYVCIVRLVTTCQRSFGKMMFSVMPICQSVCSQGVPL